MQAEALDVHSRRMKFKSVLNFLLEGYISPHVSILLKHKYVGILELFTETEVVRQNDVTVLFVSVRL